MIPILASATSSVATSTATSMPASTPSAAESTMTTAGWAFMIISWAIILAVFLFCLKRVLANKEQQSEDKAQTPPQQ